MSAAQHFDDVQVQAAITAISAPERLRAAQDMIARAAPSLRRVLAETLGQDGWFDNAHNQAVRDALAYDGLDQRHQAIRSLFTQEAELSMLVGVAIGLELGAELGYVRPAS